ncbi:MAG TPA: bifunctional 5,10-methylenetetrahydrofolate dehydrogenase/5,10-methenyltetrahydrofolate cyclohydrolase [Candidatus Limnocylindrales bacterium]|nr:bifunctional 5,10-methylenetetrahydrofolate dehydrogenase/5,10-methenyltetrahydrofolate cyclohydrolase [Candidatus Limnocylindrales bacterium]
MKLLNGKELAGFIKERQAQQVRSLKQASNIVPRLAIIRTNPDPVVDTYMRLKSQYGEDIGVPVDVHTVLQPEALKRIEQLNTDPQVSGIIVQIPLPDPSQTDTILSAVTPQKDVDGLAANTIYDAPTPIAISWLLAGYNVELNGKRIVIVGHGRLVGSPLLKMWQASNYDVAVADKSTADLAALTLGADVVVTATGKPGLITSAMVKEGAVIVDAGVATDKNGLAGDVAPDLRQRPDITITPENGGVGPLTVCALFDNVIRAARAQAGNAATSS